MCHKIQLDVEVVLGRVWKSSRGRLTAGICHPKKMALDWKIKVEMEVLQAG